MVPVIRRCQSSVWIWLENCLHLHLHLHVQNSGLCTCRILVYAPRSRHMYGFVHPGPASPRLGQSQRSSADVQVVSMSNPRAVGRVGRSLRLGHLNGCSPSSHMHGDKGCTSTDLNCVCHSYLELIPAAGSSCRPRIHPAQTEELRIHTGCHASCLICI